VPPSGFWARWSTALRSPRRSSWASVYRDLARWAAIAVPIGIVAGLGAAVFYELITLTTQYFLSTLAGITLPLEGTSNPALLVWSSSEPRIFLIPAIMVAGGLIVGVMAWSMAPEILGHGTDASIRAFHRENGKIRARVPVLKTIASAITLGTGGSGGREGPVSQIGGGFGSIWSDLVGLGDRDRRVALATGLGAGIGAIFRAPLGGAVYGAEILYTGDFEPEVFVPAIISSVVAYSVYSSILGFHTLFAAPASLVSYTFDPARLPLYAVLGVVCGGTGLLFIWMYRRTETFFASRAWSPWLKPAAGAAIASAIFLGAYVLLPQQGHFAALSSLSIGYGFVQAAMSGQLNAGSYTVLVIVVLVVAVGIRMAMTSFVVGSGGAAGLFGTSVVVGAFLGTAIGGAFHSFVPALVPATVIPVFSIIGMMSFFGGISKAPLGVLIMVTEMASSYAVLPAAMLSIFIAYVVTGRSHIYSEQLPSRIQSPAHLQEYRNYFLSETPVGEIAAQQSEPVEPSTSVQAALDLAVTHGRSVLSVESGGTWLGAARLSDLLEVPPDRRETTPVLEIARPVDLVLPGDLSAEEALHRMEEHGTNAAAVLSVDPPIRVTGIVTRRGIRNPQLDAARSNSP
jgi:chloride channel protein, CIC family